MTEQFQQQPTGFYGFDGTLSGLLCCVFNAFRFREFAVQVCTTADLQQHLFAGYRDIATDDAQASRVWTGLQQRLSRQALQQLTYAFLAEQQSAAQAVFDYAIYVFHQPPGREIEKNYNHPAVLSVAEWVKQVGREKHRMEAFVRFKKTADDLYVALISPDFNVLPLIQRHFRQRYQDQRWLIYDEKRDYGIYFDGDEVQEVHLSADQVDRQRATGKSQSFELELDNEEPLYDQLWKDYFRSVNIEARRNLRLHIQYLPRRYWRYLNEKQL